MKRAPEKEEIMILQGFYWQSNKYRKAGAAK
jgi:hypothetical protein